MFFKISAGNTVEVDVEDVAVLSQWKWTSRVSSKQRTKKRPSIYAYRQQVINGKPKMIYMHRFIIDAPDGTHVDHIDGNTLNNRKSNLRLCTRSENSRKCQSHIDRIYALPKGIEFRPDKKNKFSARICFEGKRYCLGSFFTVEEAVLVRDAKYLELELKC